MTRKGLPWARNFRVFMIFQHFLTPQRCWFGQTERKWKISQLKMLLKLFLPYNYPWNCLVFIVCIKRALVKVRILFHSGERKEKKTIHLGGMKKFALIYHGLNTLSHFIISRGGSNALLCSGINSHTAWEVVWVLCMCQAWCKSKKQKCCWVPKNQRVRK